MIKIIVNLEFEPAQVGRKCEQVLKMNRSAYNYYKSPNSRIKGFSNSQWSRLNASQRLQSHIEEIKKDLGAKSFDYQVMED